MVSQLEGPVHHSYGHGKQLLTLHPQSGCRDECWYPTHRLLFYPGLVPILQKSTTHRVGDTLPPEKVQSRNPSLHTDRGVSPRWFYVCVKLMINFHHPVAFESPQSTKPSSLMPTGTVRTNRPRFFSASAGIGHLLALEFGSCGL